MLNNPLCVKDGRFLYPIGTRGTTREKKSRRDQSLADLGYPTLVGYTPTIEIYIALSFPECSGHSPH